MHTHTNRCIHTPTSIVVVFCQANSTFEYLDRIKTAAEDWLKVSPNITTYLSTNPQVEQLKVKSIMLMLCKYDSIQVAVELCRHLMIQIMYHHCNNYVNSIVALEHYNMVNGM